jgi:hypothetical protein
VPHAPGPEAVVSINQLASPLLTMANVVENGIRRTLIETA